jgi:hypothetical protein
MGRDKSASFGMPTIPEMLSVRFSQAKLWWGLGVTSQFLAVLVGSLLVLTHKNSLVTALAIAVASIIANVAKIHANRLKMTAERLLRDWELYVGLGWTIDRKTIADILGTAEPLISLENANGRASGFHNVSISQGSRRVLYHLQESAWWTQHLSRFSGWVTLLFVGGRAGARTQQHDSRLGRPCASASVYCCKRSRWVPFIDIRNRLGADSNILPGGRSCR